MKYQKRLVLVLLLSSTFSLSAQRVTLTCKNQKLGNVLTSISRQTGMSLAYSSMFVDLNKNVSISVRSLELPVVLNHLFSNTNIGYDLRGKKILLYRKHSKSSIINEANNNVGTISGKEQKNDIYSKKERKKINGVVIDEKGNPIVGASIYVNGRAYGITDANGHFTVEGYPSNAKIQVSYIGFKTKLLTGISSGKIVLIENNKILDEAVVVGYGSMKKVNLTGAVDQVNGDVFKDRPISNLARGLQGVIPNLNIKMYDGNPTRNPEYNIRGITSIGSGGSALILIDGVEGDPRSLNPSDIENISVLKDASSAAIYGARGTFGVILITTKKARKGEVNINYSGNYSINRRTVIPDFISNGYEWAKMFNEAHYQWYGQNPTAINSAYPFSQEYLSELKKHDENPSLPKVDIDKVTGKYIYYDNHDWQKDLYRDVNPSMEHSLSISGGGNRASYYLSGRFYSQSGIYRYNTDDYKTYSVRARGDIWLTKWLSVYNNFNYSNMDYKEPLYYGGWGFNSEISMGWTMRSFPVVPMLNPDGTITEMGARSLGDLYYGKNKAKTGISTINDISGFTLLLGKELKLSGDFAFTIMNSGKTRAYSSVPYSNIENSVSWLGSSRYFDRKINSSYISVNLYMKYNKDFGDHHITGLLGYNYEQSNEKSLEVSRDGLLDPDNPSFALADGQVYSTIDSSNDWAIVGGFYRLGYNYKDRYLFETNGRVDGSSKFPVNQRFGFFPSFSAGWRISEEPFWNVSKDIVSLLKVRASWGALGNGNIASYSYIASMPVSTSTRLINGQYQTYTDAPGIIPKSLTWEKASTINVGLDLSLFHSKLNLTADVYRRFTDGMFTKGKTLPAVLGTDVPKGNNADLRTDGWELSVSWNDVIGENKPLKYGIRFILSDNKTKITKYNNPNKNLNDYYEGMTMGEIWGYVTEGLFKDQEDINNHVSQNRIKSNGSGVLFPGDIKFKNLNGDNEISPGANRVGDSGDRKIIGNSEPRYTFGLNLNTEWNGLFADIFFQGVGKRDWYPTSESIYFWGQYNRPYSPLPKYILDNYYNADPEHPNVNAYFPRYVGLLANGTNNSLSVVQTRYLQKVSYIRLKNLTVGYNFPEKIISKLGLRKASVYFTGQNIWTYSGIFKRTHNIDPETIEAINPDTGGSAFGGGNGYPMLMTFTLGLNLTF